jgi:hypothetical protein
MTNNIVHIIGQENTLVNSAARTAAVDREKALYFPDATRTNSARSFLSFMREGLWMYIMWPAS